MQPPATSKTLNYNELFHTAALQLYMVWPWYPIRIAHGQKAVQEDTEFKQITPNNSVAYNYETLQFLN